MNKHNWTYKKLGDSLSYIKNGANIKQVKGASGIPITRIETLSGGVFNRDRFGYANILTADKYSQYIMDDGDILMSHINSKAYIGRSVLYRKNGNEIIIHGMNLLRLKAIPSIVSSSFLNQVFKSDRFRDCVARIRKDSVNQSSMAISDLIKIPIPVPPLEEQEAIVAELDEINEVIAGLQQQVADLDALAQSTFYTMFGDTVTNEKGWEVKKLGEVATSITDGDHMPPPKSQSGIPFITISNVDREKGVIDFKNTFYVSKEYFKTIIDNRRPKVGDVLYTVTGSYGIPILIKNQFDFCFQRHIALIRPSDVINSLFLHGWAKSPSIKGYADSVATGVAQKTVSLGALRKFPIIIPPLALQQEFAAKVKEIEAAKAEINTQIAEMQTLLNSRMDYYFN